VTCGMRSTSSARIARSASTGSSSSRSAASTMGKPSPAAPAVDLPKPIASPSAEADLPNPPLRTSSTAPPTCAPCAEPARPRRKSPAPVGSGATAAPVPRSIADYRGAPTSPLGFLPCSPPPAFAPRPGGSIKSPSPGANRRKKKPPGEVRIHTPGGSPDRKFPAPDSTSPPLLHHSPTRVHLFFTH